MTLLKVLFFGVAMALRGYTIMMLWFWFVVPFGLPAIHIFWALGLSAFGSLFSTWPSYRDAEDQENNLEAKLYAHMLIILAPLMALGFGFLWATLGGMR